MLSFRDAEDLLRDVSVRGHPKGQLLIQQGLIHEVTRQQSETCEEACERHPYLYREAAVRHHSCAPLEHNQRHIHKREDHENNPRRPLGKTRVGTPVRGRARPQ
jgi:hypothetical protein